MKRTLAALALILVLLYSVLTGVMLVERATANPFPTNPVISIESPVNKTYNVNSLALNVTVVTKFDGWYFTGEKTLAYSIDGEANISITETNYSFDEEIKASTFNGSAFLSELTDGLHKLTVYATYDYGTRIFEAQSSTYFTIDFPPSPNGTLKPFPTVWIVAIVAVVGVGLMVYFWKCRK